MEIELKFLIQPDLVAKFTAALDSSHFHILKHDKKQLLNGYFDTQSQALRDFDMGLRIRSTTSSSGEVTAEQTVKLAGKDIGGLHQRPEFNVDLDTPVSMLTDLSLFDSKIWPDGFIPSEIQPKLNLLFETDFERTSWLIEMPSGTEIECVLDQGQVVSGDESSIISEIELELVSGQVNDLFVLAQFISAHVDVRLGFLSKAARGYQLLSGKTIKTTELKQVKLSQDVQFEPAMIQTLSEALKFVQHNEQVFCSSMSPKALRKVIDGWSLIIHLLQLFSEQLPQTQVSRFIEAFKTVRQQHKWVDGFYQINQLLSRKSPYRKDIESSEHLSALMAEQQLSEHKLMKAVGFFSTKEYNQLIVNFIQWLSQKQWRMNLPLEQLSVLEKPLTDFASMWLERSWQNVQISLADYKNNPDKSNLVALYWPLVESLLTGLTVGSLFDEQNTQIHNGQHDLLVGCEEFLLLTRLEKLLENELLKEGASEVTADDSPSVASEHEPFNYQSPDDNNKSDGQEYLSWVKGKQDSLNRALSASVGNVSQIKTYW